MSTRVVTDSGGGLSETEARLHGIDYLPLQVQIDDQTYLDGVNLSLNALYQALEEGKMPRTSLPPLGLIEDLFEQYQKEGVTDIILITLSDGLSSTNQAVQMAAREYGIKVHTTDIWTTLGVERYYALAAQNLLEKGIPPEEIIARIEESAAKSRGYLMVDDLNHLAAGGRLTPLAAKLAGLLKIKPILAVGKATEGKVDQYDKVRTLSKAVKKACDIVEGELEPDTDYLFIVLDGKSPEARIPLKRLEKMRPEAPVWQQPMYSVIACHTGLGSVGVQYVPRLKDEDLTGAL